MFITQQTFTCLGSALETLLKRGVISSKPTITIQERRLLRGSGVFIATSEHISHLFIVFLLLTLNRLAGKFAHDRIIENKIPSQIIIT